MPLILRKDPRDTHNPWHLIYVYPAGQAHPTTGRPEARVPDCRFRTKREAQEWHVRLCEIGDWAQYDTWTQDQHNTLAALVAETPLAQEREAVLARGTAAWNR